MRAHRHRALFAALCVVAAVVVASAVAAPGPKPVAVSDPIDARAGAPDLIRVQLGVAPGNRLRAVLTFAAPWVPKDLLAADGPPGSVCLRLWTQTKPGAAPPDYLVCVSGRADGETARGSVLRLRPGRSLLRVARAVVGRTRINDATLRFSLAAVGSPRTIRFAAEATKPGCGRVSCVDTAPAAPATAVLRLRRAA
jgi:hypothetical protein